MSRGHVTTIVQNRDLAYYFRCQCGATSGTTPRLTRQLAEDDKIKHEQEVARAVAGLRRSRGSLLIERDHAKQMMEDPNTPEKDREAWRILYEGAAQRLGHPVNENPLWE